MKFIYGVRTNDGIEVYNRGFNTVERVMDETENYCITLRDEADYKDFASGSVYTDIGVFPTHYKARTGFVDACKQLIMDMVEPNNAYSQKMWCIKKDVSDEYTGAKYKFIEYCWVDYVKSYAEGNVVGFSAETIEVRVRENLNTSGIDFVDMENCPCNEHIIDDILNGEATEVPANSETMNRIKEFIKDNVERFYIRLFRGFEK